MFSFYNKISPFFALSHLWILSYIHEREPNSCCLHSCACKAAHQSVDKLPRVSPRKKTNSPPAALASLPGVGVWWAHFPSVLILGWSCVDKHNCWELMTVTAYVSRRHRLTAALPSLWLLGPPTFPWQSLSRGVEGLWYRCPIWVEHATVTYPLHSDNLWLFVLCPLQKRFSEVVYELVSFMSVRTHRRQLDEKNISSTK